MRISDWSSDVCSSDLDDADDIRLRLAARDRLHRARYRTRAAHVPLHHVHARPWLQADAAGVEGDALADEHHRRLPRRAAVPAHREQSRRPRRALRDAERSEENTSELQSLMRNPYAGFCLKKK